MMTGRFNITNDRELRCAYEVLHEFQRLKSRKFADLRHEIRAYTRKKKTMRIIKDDGADGYIELVDVGLPVGVYDDEFAEDVFKRDYFIEMRPSAYDCTGRKFTAWYKIFERNGWWYAYHCVRIDC